MGAMKRYKLDGWIWKRWKWSYWASAWAVVRPDFARFLVGLNTNAESSFGFGKFQRLSSWRQLNLTVFVESPQKRSPQALRAPDAVQPNYRCWLAQKSFCLNGKIQIVSSSTRRVSTESFLRRTPSNLWSAETICRCVVYEATARLHTRIGREV